MSSRLSFPHMPLEGTGQRDGCQMRNHLVKGCSGNHGRTWRIAPTYRSKVIRPVMDSDTCKI